MYQTKVLRLKSVMEMTGMSRSSIYLYVEKGIFPKPIRLGPRAVGWILDEVESWLKTRLDLRQPK